MRCWKTGARWSRPVDDDEDIRKAAPEQFIEELQDVRWGLFSLNLSRWLLARTWTAET